MYSNCNNGNEGLREDWREHAYQTTEVHGAATTAFVNGEENVKYVLH